MAVSVTCGRLLRHKNIITAVKSWSRTLITSQGRRVPTKLDADDGKTTHFGFEDVREEEKQERGRWWS